MGSAIHGELAFFDLRDLHLIRTEVLDGWATACGLVPTGNGLFVADNESGTLQYIQLNAYELQRTVSIAGTPVDLAVSHNTTAVHLITNNSRYYRFPYTLSEPDTVFVGDNPRRIRLQPQIEQFAWIVCRGEGTVRVIRESGLEEVRSISFPSPCTDVTFSPDGVRAYCAVPNERKIYVVDTQNGAFTDSLAGIGGVIDLCMSDQGHHLIAADSVSGNTKLFDLERHTDELLNCGSSAIRPAYSVSSHAFFVICPVDSFVVRVDPFSVPAKVTDTLRVEPFPQCISFLE